MNLDWEEKFLDWEEKFSLQYCNFEQKKSKIFAFFLVKEK